MKKEIKEAIEIASTGRCSNIWVYRSCYKCEIIEGNTCPIIRVMAPYTDGSWHCNLEFAKKRAKEYLKKELS